jgi:hypothetical protein
MVVGNRDVRVEARSPFTRVLTAEECRDRTRWRRSVHVTDKIRYMLDDLVTASEAELDVWARQIRTERMRRHGLLITCRQCGEQVVARRDAKYCSTRCRVAAHRASRRLA